MGNPSGDRTAYSGTVDETGNYHATPEEIAARAGARPDILDLLFNGEGSYIGQNPGLIDNPGSDVEPGSREVNDLALADELGVEPIDLSWLQNGGDVT
jgi:hypothetical protein